MFWLFVTDELSQRLEGAMTLPTVVVLPESFWGTCYGFV